MTYKVLFICTHNSARSQMAEGLVNALFPGRVQAFSAGTAPTSVHPLAIAAMAEVGLDISGHRSKHLREFQEERFDLVVTVCDGANEVCPFFAGAKEREHVGFPDPSAVQGTEDDRLNAFRQVRDQLSGFVRERFARSN